MISIKTEEQLDKIRAGGVILSEIVGEIAGMVRPGVSSAELEAHVVRRMEEAGGRPAFKGYGGGYGVPPFPTAICFSLNNEVVHGPAMPGRVIEEGDLVSLDCGLEYQGHFTDMAVTVGAGEVLPEHIELCRVTREALDLGVAQVRDGGWVSDIGKAVDKHVRRHGLATVKDLVGHGVGNGVHEEPQIPNFLDRRMPPVRLKSGYVLAIEPMVNIGREDVRTLKDGWTVVTADGSMSAHYEMTVIVTPTGPEIVTPLPEFFAEI